MTFSLIRRGFAFVAFLLVATSGAANAVDPIATIVESQEVWSFNGAIESTDIVRFRDEWVCVMQTEEGLQLIGSKDGKSQSWRPLSIVTPADKNFPLRNPRLTVTHPGKAEDLRGRLMLTAVVPRAPLGGISKTWLSKDFYERDVTIEWHAPEVSAEDDYLISSVSWHVGVAYNFQRGSSCGNASTLRIGASNDGKRFEDRFEKTMSGFPRSGALVFTQNEGFCVMAATGKQGSAALGVSRAPFYRWYWSQLPQGLKHPNAIRSSDGRLLVVAGLLNEHGQFRTTLCELNQAVPRLVPLVEVPTSRSCFVGLANCEGQVFLSYQVSGPDGSSVQLARVSMETQ